MSDYFLAEACRLLRPDYGVSIENGIITWSDNALDIPSDDELNAKATELENAHVSKQYARDRAAEYPPIGDQLDDLFHAGVFSAEMAAKIQAVKDKYPKG